MMDESTTNTNSDTSTTFRQRYYSNTNNETKNSQLSSSSSSSLSVNKNLVPLVKTLRLLVFTLVTLVLLSTLFNVQYVQAEGNYYSTSDRHLASEMMGDYGDNIAKLFYAKKRSCIRRGAICDLRPGDCCGNSICKCNLWGANCRCQRMGLFQRWGKK